MLDTRTPFPQVGAYALIEDGRTTSLVRIQKRIGADALLSFPLRPGVASGNPTLPIDRLINADPLTDEERAELATLERSAGKTGKRRARLEELRTRDARSETARRLLDRMPFVRRAA